MLCLHFAGYIVAISEKHVRRNIGNCLKLCQRAKHSFDAKSAASPPHKYQNSGQKTSMNDNSRKCKKTLGNLVVYRNLVAKAIKGLQDILGALGITEECSAVWTDGDLTADLRDYRSLSEILVSMLSFRECRVLTPARALTNSCHPTS